MDYIAAFDSLYFKISNFYRGKVWLLMSKSAEKWESCVIDHFLSEICLAADTIRKEVIHNFICISLYFCIFEKFDDQNIEFEDQKLLFNVCLKCWDFKRFQLKNWKDMIFQWVLSWYTIIHNYITNIYIYR